MPLHKLPLIMAFNVQENAVFIHKFSKKYPYRGRWGTPSTPSSRSVASLPRFDPRLTNPGCTTWKSKKKLTYTICNNFFVFYVEDVKKKIDVYLCNIFFVFYVEDVKIKKLTYTYATIFFCLLRRRREYQKNCLVIFFIFLYLMAMKGHADANNWRIYMRLFFFLLRQRRKRKKKNL